MDSTNIDSISMEDVKVIVVKNVSSCFNLKRLERVHDFWRCIVSEIILAITSVTKYKETQLCLQGILREKGRRKELYQQLISDDEKYFTCKINEFT